MLLTELSQNLRVVHRRRKRIIQLQLQSTSNGLRQEVSSSVQALYGCCRVRGDRVLDRVVPVKTFRVKQDLC
jgi:hypothetical protein